jgi:endoglucanase
MITLSGRKAGTLMEDRMRGFRWLILPVLWALAACAVAPAPAPVTAASAAPAQFQRGVNVLGYDDYWKDPTKARFQWRHFGEIRRAGFDFVRVNLHAFDHMDANHRLSADWLAKLDTVIREAQKAGLGVILDEHDFNACAKDVPTCRVKLAAVWRQIAPRYRNAPANVAFELLNEPNEALNAVWNDFFPDLLAIVRETNPTRTVIIGPASWNSLRELPNLQLPENDRNILVTFHYYDPFHFTHQGATWAGEEVKKLSGITWGTDSDRAQIKADFDTVAAWAAANRRPILLGEFGAYDKTGTPQAMRAAYIDAVTREAERHGFGWAHWQFDGDFIVWDMARDEWVEPIKRALIPPE